MASKYTPQTKASSKRKPVATFLTLLLLFVFVLIYNLPQIKTNFKIGNKKINSIGGYTLGNKKLDLRRGLDLQGGVQLTLQADMKGITEKDRQQALDAAHDVIDRRVNLYGVSEPVIQSARSGGDYRIIVELPGVSDTNQALDLVGKTARLEFREPDTSSPSAETASESAQLAGLDASTAAQIRQYLASQPRYKATALTGNELRKAEVTFDQRTGEPQVSLEFKDRGTKLFGDLTTKYVNKKIAIYLDDEQVSAPLVNTPIVDGHAIITIGKDPQNPGSALQEAQKLATQLNAGALPVPIKVIEQRTIGATLGAESINRSMLAGAVGIICVAVFMIILYGFLGVLADCALILYALISLFIFRFVPVTLTLAGIAGFILSIGMALDANILIFERIREELRWGKSKAEALRLGFDRAWTSIRDSNIASLITCLILYSFGTGIIRGFALTLAIGIAVSLFTAITVTRTLLRMFNR